MSSSGGVVPDFDLNVWENGTIGIGEKNIFQGLIMPDNFILPGMDCTIELESSCLAKHRDKPLEKESLSHEFILTESYLMKSSIQLETTSAIVARSGMKSRKTIEYLYKKLMSVNGVYEAELNYIHQRLLVKTDM